MNANINLIKLIDTKYKTNDYKELEREIKKEIKEIPNNILSNFQIKSENREGKKLFFHALKINENVSQENIIKIKKLIKSNKIKYKLITTENNEKYIIPKKSMHTLKTTTFFENGKYKAMAKFGTMIDVESAKIVLNNRKFYKVETDNVKRLKNPIKNFINRNTVLAGAKIKWDIARLAGGKHKNFTEIGAKGIVLENSQGHLIDGMHLCAKDLWKEIENAGGKPIEFSASYNITKDFEIKAKMGFLESGSFFQTDEKDFPQDFTVHHLQEYCEKNNRLLLHDQPEKGSFLIIKESQKEEWIQKKINLKNNLTDSDLTIKVEMTRFDFPTEEVTFYANGNKVIGSLIDISAIEKYNFTTPQLEILISNEGKNAVLLDNKLLVFNKKDEEFFKNLNLQDEIDELMSIPTPGEDLVIDLSSGNQREVTKPFRLFYFDSDSDQNSIQKLTKKLNNLGLENTHWHMEKIGKIHIFYNTHEHHILQSWLTSKNLGLPIKQSTVFISPPSESDTTIVISHNQTEIYEQSPENFLAWGLSGINVVSFNHPGKGMSEGYLDDEGMYQANDSVMVYLKENIGVSPSKIISLGQCGGIFSAVRSSSKYNTHLIVDQAPENISDVAVEYVKEIMEEKLLNAPKLSKTIVNGTRFTLEKILNLNVIDYLKKLSPQRSVLLISDIENDEGAGGDKLVPSYHPNKMIQSLPIPEDGAIHSIAHIPGGEHVTHWWNTPHSTKSIQNWIEKAKLLPQLSIKESNKHFDLLEDIKDNGDDNEEDYVPYDEF